jgi:protoporphyrinogen oxidase
MLNRRELITALLGSQVALLAGCSNRSLPPAGELLAPNFAVGHQIRDQFAWPSSTADEKVDVVIVGGGIAGLSAARRLRQGGVEDFTVLEMEHVAGGTSCSGSQGAFQYPWGAHYITTPMAENEDLVQLLREMQVLQAVQENGSPIVKEQLLCREPEERVFYAGSWQEGLYPEADASERDWQELSAFRSEVDRWVTRRDASGQYLFAIPMSQRSTSDEVMSLDQISMLTWMDRQGWTSPRLRWLVDYSCRDDYGLSIDQTSAWAGVFYFASRLSGPGQESQGVITWPAGNGRIVEHLAEACGDRLRTGQAVVEITQDDQQVRVLLFDTNQQRVRQLLCKRLVFAAGQFLVPHVVRGLDADRIAAAKRFQYGSWMVANVHLSQRPAESGFPMAWDNVIHDSKSLGYVTATHQSGIDDGATVLTWYYPFNDVDAKVSRQQLLALDWSHWADLTLSDLSIPHPDIYPLVTRLDVMRWGHAMIQPRVGFVSSAAVAMAANSFGRVHFAGTDLSGVALMEEAFYHGNRAADEVLRALEKRS